jgi:hypothetical protein
VQEKDAPLESGQPDVQVLRIYHWYAISKYEITTPSFLDYTRCPGFNRGPERGNFKVPKDLLESMEFLSEYNEKKLLPGGRQYSISVINNEIIAPKLDERRQRKSKELTFHQHLIYHFRIGRRRKPSLHREKRLHCRSQV